MGIEKLLTYLGLLQVRPSILKGKHHQRVNTMLWLWHDHLFLKGYITLENFHSLMLDIGPNPSGITARRWYAGA